MNDLDCIRELLPPAAPPSNEAKRRASARLAQAIGDEARQRTAGDKQPALTRVLRLIQTRPRSSAVALATVVVAAAASLFLSAPWQQSPGFLAKANAALVPPPGSILHMTFEFTTTSNDPPCTNTYGPNESWTDKTPPYRFRARFVEPDLPPSSTDARALVCAKAGTPTEIGGPVNARVAKFEAPNTLVNVGTVQTLTRPPDPVRDLREAIRTERAHDEGKTTLDGRTVELIRVDPPRPPNCSVPCPTEPVSVYVDVDTFHPIAEQSVQDVTLDAVHVVRVKWVRRFLTYEYLPRTPENLALTDIRAQHPTACLKDFWGLGATNRCG